MQRILKNYYKWNQQMWYEGCARQWDLIINTLYLVGDSDDINNEQHINGCDKYKVNPNKDVWGWYTNKTLGKYVLRIPRYKRQSVENSQNKGLQIQIIKQGWVNNRRQLYKISKVGLTDMVSGIINDDRLEMALGSWIETQTKSVYVSASEVKQWLNLSLYDVWDLYVNVIKPNNIKNRKWCKLLLILKHVKTKKHEPKKSWYSIKVNT